MTLMIGPVLARPVDREVLDALTDVSIETKVGERSRFTLTFNISTRSPLHTLFLLAGGGQIPVMRVIVVVTVNGAPNVLIDGVITHQQTQPGTTPGQATLTVSGDDLTAVMDQIDFTGFPFPCLPAEGRVALMVAKYAWLGVVPAVIPSVLMDIPVPTDRIPVQLGTDFAYITQLANEAGYEFYLEPGPAAGSSVAYWGPQIRVGTPQPALNVDMDAHTNVESLSFNFDAENAAMLAVYIQLKALGVSIPIPIPSITPLSPPLALVPPIPTNFYALSGASALGPIRAAAIALAQAAKSSDSVTGTGTLNVQRYGRLLKARQLVGVRGAGTAYDGLYYVSSVKHTIQRGEYKQDFTLVRNGLVSNVQKVPA